MADIVRPLKLEDDNQLDMLPTETDPSEDALAAKGVYFEAQTTHAIESFGDEVRHKDVQVILEKPLRQLAFNHGYREIISTERVYVESEQEMFITGELVLDGELYVDGILTSDTIEVPSVAIPDDNFSFWDIPINTTKTIPVTQQMLVDALIQIDGQINIEGELSIIIDEDTEDQADEFLPPFEILINEFFTVGERREMFLTDVLLLDGTINIDGKLSIGA